MNIELKNYFVAFIDILGFKEMVKHDSESPNSNYKFVQKLYDAHIEAKQIGNTNEEIETYQFSDSIVISMPFKKDKFRLFCEIVKKYQIELFEKEILCRGGISIGKHFSNSSFLFSQGLIEAYYLESAKAITPRVIISQDLIDLIYQNKSEIPEELILLENDSTHFINYFSTNNKESIEKTINNITNNGLNKNTSIRQKQIWLIEYFNHTFPQDRRDNYWKFSTPKNST